MPAIMTIPIPILAATSPLCAHSVPPGPRSHTQLSKFWLQRCFGADVQPHTLSLHCTRGTKARPNPSGARAMS